MPRIESWSRCPIWYKLPNIKFRLFPIDTQHIFIALPYFYQFKDISFNEPQIFIVIFIEIFIVISIVISIAISIMISIAVSIAVSIVISIILNSKIPNN